MENNDTREMIERGRAYLDSVMENELEHAGIKGMKWGRRLYQNKDGSLTPLGRIRYKKEKARAAEERAKERAEKNRVIKSGTADEVVKMSGKMTQKEREKALSRLKFEKSVKDITPKEVDEGKTSADKAVDKIGKLTTQAVTVTKAYNMVANVINAFNGVDKKLLPKIDTDIVNGNRDKRKSEKDEAEKKGKKSSTNPEEILKKLDKMSNEDVAALSKRLNEESNIRNKLGVDKNDDSSDTPKTESSTTKAETKTKNQTTNVDTATKAKSSTAKTEIAATKTETKTKNPIMSDEEYEKALKWVNSSAAINDLAANHHPKTVKKKKDD